ncbi:hypothetical protein MPTK1_4g10380 [Marchantia polymorpha subsp. ruderalis]|uniref:Uncharacterized protein n=2 Tax=Marchantia polymorpha TaxID=3197 RepID=A0AAF6B8F6_MARPO|nr:hypothetical protein MARPO_0011s0025 [Marchantia polymorpha]BBN08290.1 hypothetical protein Mp_4g10380 [Marchantia polymorpha subsp. ruderalis]|eukprot:PTQ46326.1 hypothetical protein MARPO_0011s0025 [Marchantia polymorpha]
MWKRGETGPPVNLAEEQESLLGDMQRWYSEGHHDPRRAGSDVHVLPDQFTDVVPALPVYKVKQKASTLGACLYSILLAFYVLLLLASSLFRILPQDKLLLPITCSCNALFLAITGVLQRHLIAEQQKEQREGYLRFSKRLEWIIQLPFAVFAFGTAGLLLVVVWQPIESQQWVTSLFLVRVLVLVEIVLTFILIGTYLRKVKRHHAVERHPDVMNSLYSALNPPASLHNARHNDGGLAEQQAVLLHYQQDNLRYLSEEILRLQETLSKFDRSQDGTTPQVDVVHLLAAREQELRAVTAERDQLLAELRLARTLISERDEDILRVRTINDQYVEENQRVRAMLDEWSSRTAKLEIALEAERLANADLHKSIYEQLNLELEASVEFVSMMEGAHESESSVLDS